MTKPIIFSEWTDRCRICLYKNQKVEVLAEVKVYDFNLDPDFFKGKDYPQRVPQDKDLDPAKIPISSFKGNIYFGIDKKICRIKDPNTEIASFRDDQEISALCSGKTLYDAVKGTVRKTFSGEEIFNLSEENISSMESLDNLLYILSSKGNLYEQGRDDELMSGILAIAKYKDNIVCLRDDNSLIGLKKEPSLTKPDINDSSKIKGILEYDSMICYWDQSSIYNLLSGKHLLRLGKNIKFVFPLENTT